MSLRKSVHIPLQRPSQAPPGKRIRIVAAETPTLVASLEAKFF